MNIVGLIRSSMVMTVMSGPPDRPALNRRAPQEGAHKLDDTTGLKRSMRKISMVESRRAEDSGEVNNGSY